MRVSACLVLVGSLVAVEVGYAQAPPKQAAPSKPQTQTPARASEIDTTAVTAIVVDVIVRDKNGNPVPDLTAQDFELSEDGVRQEIGSFTPIAGAPRELRTPTNTAPATNASAAKPEAAPQVIALVFDRLSPDGRAFARKAALGYIGEGGTSQNTIAIFGIDLSLALYQPFTRDGALLRKGIDAISGRSTSQYGNTRDAKTRATETIAQSQAAGAGGANGNASAAADAQFAAMELRMMNQFDSLEHDQQGYATSNALLAIVSALKQIPGRKSVIFFSEGLSIPPNVQRQFISVIDAANRANVSIYPMDAAGLRTESPLAESQAGMRNGATLSLANADANGVADGAMTAALERNEELLRADPHSGLGTLADQTGGFLIANSNDLRGGFTKIDTDMRNYYVLTYVPSNPKYDGKFREIDVKVKRSGTQVRARKGYFAIRPSTNAAPVLTYEAPALAMLEQTPVPNAFPVRAMALRFPEEDRTDLVPVIVNVPTAGITFKPAADKKTYTSDFIVLVRFRDDAGAVFGKVSQRYQINGPIEKIDRATQGEVLFYREPVLFPGVFTMETVVYDALASKATVRVQTVDIQTTNAKQLRMSSLMAIRRSEKVPEADRLPDSPLYVGDQLLYPNMGEPFSKTASTELPFYFVAYPESGASAGETKATLELLSNGKQLARAPLELSHADQRGRIAQLGRIPIEALQPGSYELRVTLQQGPHSASRALTFRVAP